MTDKFAIVAYKATRGAIKIDDGFQSFIDACATADKAFLATKAISFNWLTGISVMVVASEHLPDILASGITNGDCRILMQYGSY